MLVSLALFGASLHFQQRFIRGIFVVSTLILSQLLQLCPGYIFPKLGQHLVGANQAAGGFEGAHSSTIVTIKPAQPPQSLEIQSPGIKFQYLNLSINFVSSVQSRTTHVLLFGTCTVASRSQLDV